MAATPNAAAEAAKANAAHTAMLTHIILPRKLPSHVNEADEDMETEGLPIKNFAAASAKFLALIEKTDPYHATMSDMTRMMHRWAHEFGERPSVVALRDRVRRGNDKYPTAIAYLPNFNSSVTVYPEDAHHVRVYAYQHHPMPSDGVPAFVPRVEMSYPAVALRVKRSDIDNATFWQLLQDMSGSDAIKFGGSEAGSPSAVFDWLLPSLPGVRLGDDETRQLWKRSRSEIQHSPIGRHWRRSSLWVAQKAILHHFFVLRLGAELGTLLYKITMAFFFLSLLEDVIERQTDEPIPLDLLAELQMKIAASAEKLTHRCNELRSALPDAAIPHAYNIILNKPERLISSELIVKALGIPEHDFDLAEYVSDVCESDWVTATKHNFADVCKLIQKTRQLRERPQEASAVDTEAIPTHCHLREFRADGDPTQLSTRSNHLIRDLAHAKDYSQRERALIDTEKFVEGSLWPSRNSILRSADICDQFMRHLMNLQKQYVSVASGVYANDPIRTSVMTLTAFAITALVDYIASERHELLSPVYREHKFPYFGTPFHALLLTTDSQLKMMGEVELYLATKSKARFGSVLDLSITGVPYRWASSHQIAEKAAIQREDDEKVRVHTTENYLAAKIEARQRRTKMENYHHNPFLCYTRRCGQCSYYRKLVRDYNTAKTYTVIERYLPEDRVRADVAVFWTRLPVGFACLLECVYSLAYMALGKDPLTRVASDMWPSTKNPFNTNIALGSSRRRQHFQLTVEDHPADSFVLPCSMDCSLNFQYVCFLFFSFFFFFFPPSTRLAD
jgi:hypothetical protein